MPLTVRYAEKYNDALMALAAVTHRPANIVNVAGSYAIRVDLEYNRYVLATNTHQGLTDEPAFSDRWLVRFFQTSTDGLSDGLLSEATHQWLIDAFDSALESLEVDGKKIVADANFGDINRTEASPTAGVYGSGTQS